MIFFYTSRFGINAICDSFVERDCKWSHNGAEYQGHHKVSASGRPCLPWTEGIVADPNSNYCRLPAVDYGIGLYCMVDVDGTVTPETCDVPYCGMFNTFF